MRYQKIESRIWNDEKFVTLEAGAQRLWFYILTSPHNNLLGCYVLKPGYACDDLKCLPKSFRKDLAKLLAKGLVEYDEAVQVVYIKNFLKHNPLTNPNQLKSAVTVLANLPRSPLLEKVVNKIKGLMEAAKGLSEGLVQGLTEGLNEVLTKPETEAETEAEDRNKLGKRKSPGNGVDKALLAHFDSLWSEYPNPVGKKAALKSFVASVKTAQDLKNIRKALKNYKESLTTENWKKAQNGSTWFNNWQDWVGFKGVKSTQADDINRGFEEGAKP